jgi:sarcosine oxidase subunit alpha
VGGETGAEWLARVTERLRSAPKVTILTRTTAFGYYDHNQVALLQRVADHRPPRPGEPRQRLWHVRARQVVLATGAHERSMLFANNDRPGVMLAGAAQTYVNRFAVRPGHTAVVYANNDSGYAAALDLAAGGVRVAAFVDTRPGMACERRGEILSVGVEHLPGSAVIAASGRRRVKAVEVASVDAPSGVRRRIACDLLCVSGGWTPAVHLHAQARGRPIYDPALECFLPGSSVQAERSVGAAAGTFSLADAIKEGEAAGRAAAIGDAVPKDPKQISAESGRATGSASMARSRTRGKRFVDLQGDVTDSDIDLAVREGFHSVEHVKRYTTLGMGTDQGKTSNALGYARIAEALGGSLHEGGTTTFRPPYVPVTLGALAGMHGGRHFLPNRRTPIHERHLAAGAIMLQSGPWLRPQCYPRTGESPDMAFRREALAVRSGVGLVDVSTLGKFELFGSDAAEFLERIYVNRWRNLPVGRSRYGIMLREDGMIFDDGTTTRLGEQHFFITTTTAQAGSARRRLEHCRQVLWPDLDVYLVPVTDQWAAIALAGPKSRAVLERVVAGIRVDDASLPPLGARIGEVAGAPSRILRVSFSGERAYELYVPATEGAQVWDALQVAGAEQGITPYGIDAMNALRIEKGHVTGAELNGRTTPGDLGFARMVKADRDFIGKRSLGRPGLVDPARWQLVGLAPVNGATPLPAGAKIVADPKRAAPNPILGELTSSTWSPALDMPIGLALLAAGRARHGEKLWAVSPLLGAEVEVMVRDPVFVDPEGERLHG